MFRRLAAALLVFAVSGSVRPLAAQSFEGLLRQRTIDVSLDALADRGFDVSEALFDISIEDILALRSQLEGRGDMTVTDEEILIKGRLMRMDAPPEEGPGYTTIDLAAGVVRMVRLEEGIYIEMIRADMEQMSALAGEHDEERPEVTETRQSRTINGMSATAYDVMSFDGPSRVWVSNDDAELTASFQELGELMSMMGMDDPDPATMVSEHGIPVLIQTLTYDLYHIEELVSVDRRAVSQDVFGVPAGLERMTMQDMMGGMMPPDGGGVAGGMEAPPAWIEYEVAGAWSASGREEDVVMCTDNGEQFLARSLGDVIIDLEADGHGEGRHEMSVYVSNGSSGRSEGRGTLTIRATGQESYGMQIFEVDFESSDLESREGTVVTVRGKLMCAAM